LIATSPKDQIHGHIDGVAQSNEQPTTVTGLQKLTEGSVNNMNVEISDNNNSEEAGTDRTIQEPGFSENFCTELGDEDTVDGESRGASDFNKGSNTTTKRNS